MESGQINYEGPMTAVSPRLAAAFETKGQRSSRGSDTYAYKRLKRC